MPRPEKHTMPTDLEIADTAIAAVAAPAATATPETPAPAATPEAQPEVAPAATPEAATPPAEGEQTPEAWEIEIPEGEPETDPAAPAAEVTDAPAALKSILENPEIKAAVEKNPALRDELDYLGEQSALAEEYVSVFPTVTEAKAASEDAGTLRNIDEMFYSDDAQKHDELMNLLIYERDENGEFRREPTTDQRIVTPAWRYIANQNIRAFLGTMRQQADMERNDLLREQIDAVASAYDKVAGAQAPAGNGSSVRTQMAGRKSQSATTPAQPAAQPQLTQEAVGKMHADLVASVDSSLTKLAGDALGKMPFPAPVKTLVAAKVVEALNAAADANKAFQASQDRILQAGGATPETMKKLEANAIRFARNNLRTVAMPIIEQMGGKVKAAEEQRRAKVAQQAQRVEPRGTGNGTKPVNGDLNALVKQTQVQAGRRLTDSEIVDLATGRTARK